MSEPESEGRPAAHGTASESLDDDTASLTLTADELARIGEVSRRIGFEAAFTAMRLGGEDAARAARGMWTHPRHAEIEQRRTVDHEPCAQRCGRCSRCIHAGAWQRRGGRDFRGLDGERAQC